MSTFWKVVIIVVVVMIVMVAITYLNQDVKGFAVDLATKHKLPLWLVGLAAPILYVFKGLGSLLTGEGETEKGIREKNETIKDKLGELENRVKELSDWREREIKSRMEAIATHEKTIESMEGRAKGLDASISGLLERREQLQNAITEDSGNIE